MAPYYLWRRRGRKPLAGWRERFGLLPPSIRQEAQGAIWIHAVSVGETIAVAGLVRELQRRYPERRIFLSHVTPTGREVGEKQLPDLAGRFYLPFDWTWAVRRAMEHIRPSVLLIVETELWPNILRAARDFGCRSFLVNARLSDRSFRGYRMVRPFMRRILGNIDRICAQTAADAERFRMLGASPERVSVTGNLKFDSRAPEFGEFGARIREALAVANRSPIFAAASTMPGEEPLVLQAWQTIRKRYPQALMILAPRHPGRFDEVEELLRTRGLKFVRRTGFAQGSEAMHLGLASAEILLLDTIGELAEMFGLADIVFVGGSLVPTGGHNVLEPAFWGKPIAFGPHMSNFRDVASLFLGAGAAVQVADATELGQELLHLLDNPEEARRMGEMAKRVVAEQAGATLRVLNQMEEWLGAPSTAATPVP
ncbi:MAG: 3-deoxy-D-manno-octulosonic acid transferase [Acidobacteria bacterium]|nr:3-deoxy-D-manno-octulosonic acid transferase [Acidobacteriota bacterium]